VVSDFIGAGAASGDAVLFFNEDNPDKVDTSKYDNIHVVVTTLRGVALPSGYRAVSPVFSIASTAPLPANTNPTLLIVNPLRGDVDTARLRIYRLNGDNAEQLPTFFSNGATFAAVPLKSGTSTLFDTGSAEHVERYVLAELSKAEVESTTA
jgi:hypothetical protein